MIKATIQNLAGALLTLGLVASGCATTQQVAISDRTYCPFLGTEVCRKLVATETPGRFSTGNTADSTADLRYVDPNVRWSQYTKILIQPVTFWGEDDEKLSAQDQLYLTNYFYQALEQKLGTKFQIVSEPGPGVMRLQVGLEDATTATPVLRTISMLVPQARALATLKLAATGTYPFVGSAQAAGKLTDSVTGQVLLAAVDRRVGGGAVRTAAQWQLGDAESAINTWAQVTTDRLSAWTSGTAKP